MQTIQDFAERLTSERKRLELTQAQFAEACGGKSASQYLYEKGERTPNAEYLLKASSLGVRISYLFDGDKDTLNSSSLTTVELGKIYKQCDDKSRDSLGRLLDLEIRAEDFVNMVKEALPEPSSGSTDTE